ncbi:MAG: hypothetical protein NE334_13430 [Lentisphaeraceae bacterium]|nr:hypothetical protein [Lentisphaeraceae bacterium]
MKNFLFLFLLTVIPYWSSAEMTDEDAKKLLAFTGLERDEKLLANLKKNFPISEKNILAELKLELPVASENYAEFVKYTETHELPKHYDLGFLSESRISRQKFAAFKLRLKEDSDYFSGLIKVIGSELRPEECLSTFSQLGRLRSAAKYFAALVNMRRVEGDYQKAILTLKKGFT